LAWVHRRKKKKKRKKKPNSLYAEKKKKTHTHRKEKKQLTKQDPFFFFGCWLTYMHKRKEYCHHIQQSSLLRNALCSWGMMHSWWSRAEACPCTWSNYTPMHQPELQGWVTLCKSICLCIRATPLQVPSSLQDSSTPLILACRTNMRRLRQLILSSILSREEWTGLKYPANITLSSTVEPTASPASSPICIAQRNICCLSPEIIIND